MPTPIEDGSRVPIFSARGPSSQEKIADELEQVTRKKSTDIVKPVLVTASGETKLANFEYARCPGRATLSSIRASAMWNKPWPQSMRACVRPAGEVQPLPASRPSEPQRQRALMAQRFRS